MFVNSRHNGVLSPAFSQVSASPSPSAFPLLKVPNVNPARGGGGGGGEGGWGKGVGDLMPRTIAPFGLFIVRCGYRVGAITVVIIHQIFSLALLV